MVLKTTDTCNTKMHPLHKHTHKEKKITLFTWQQAQAKSKQKQAKKQQWSWERKSQFLERWTFNDWDSEVWKHCMKWTVNMVCTLSVNVTDSATKMHYVPIFTKIVSKNIDTWLACSLRLWTPNFIHFDKTKTRVHKFQVKTKETQFVTCVQCCDQAWKLDNIKSSM